MNNNLIKNLKEEGKERVLIYGEMTGKRGILKKMQAFLTVYSIELECESMQGENILHSWQEAYEKQIDAVLLTKQLISRQDIFAQIMDYCRKNNARLYDENGHHVDEIVAEAMKRDFCNKGDIIDKIEEHECISFDIFDTLLMRRVWRPEDVFEIVGKRLEKKGIYIKKFKERRIRIQEEFGLTNPDIYDIYNRFEKRYKLSKGTGITCMNEELAVEKLLLTPRKEMIEVFQKCIQSGKRVFLISDMYLPEEMLRDILNACNIKGYESIYVSCNRKQLKLQGLLQTYKDEIAANSYLHIGDSRINDGICAALADIDYCLVAGSADMVRATSFGEAAETARGVGEKIMLGMISEKVFNSPFKKGWKEGNITIDSDYQYGYCFCAALISQYVIWMSGQLENWVCDGVLFASRDGWLLQKLYEMLKQKREEKRTLPVSTYFYTSRKAAVMTGINNEAFINMIIDISAGMKPDKIMTERFGLPKSKVLKYDEQVYGDSIHQYVWEHAQAIFDRAEVAKQNYYRYMGKIGLKIGKKYGFIDFVSSGTCQKSLKRISPFTLRGFYVGWNGNEDKKNVRVESLFDNDKSYFMSHYKMMETFMTSPEPSLSHFNEDGQPVFNKQDRNEKELLYVQEMQRACYDFFEDYLDITDGTENIVDNLFLDKLFQASEKSQVTDTNSILNHLTLMDDWKHKKNKIQELLR